MQAIDVAPYSLLSLKEAFNVLVIGPAEHFVRPLENNLPIPKHEKSRIRDAEKIVFGLKMYLAAAVGGIFGGKREGIPHAVCYENAGDSFCIPQCDDELVDLFR